MPYVDGEFITDKEFEQRGFRDEYKNSVQDAPGYSWNDQTNDWNKPADNASNTNNSNGKMSQADADAWVKELAGKYNGQVTVGSTDASNLAGKNPEDIAKFQSDLEKQYAQRSSNDPHPGASSGSSVTSAWLGNGSGGGSNASGSGSNSSAQFPDWYQTMMRDLLDRQAAQEAERKGRADTLFNTLSSRANQSLAVDRNDPNIRIQSDAFSANEQRAGRNHIADLAEAMGPTANLLGEQRLVQERIGQSTGSFEAEAIGRELQAKRDEVASALAQEGAMLSGDQQALLSQQLASLDQAIKETGLNVQSQLGNRGLDVDWAKAMMLNDQFMRTNALARQAESNRYDPRLTLNGTR